MLALSLVESGGEMIAAGRKTLEIRRWKPAEVPLRNLVIVENGRSLTKAEPFDPAGRVVAVVDVTAVREWRREDAEAAQSIWEEGWLAWELENVRRVLNGPTVPAKRRIYSIECPLSALVLERT